MIMFHCLLSVCHNIVLWMENVRGFEQLSALIGQENMFATFFKPVREKIPMAHIKNCEVFLGVIPDLTLPLTETADWGWANTTVTKSNTGPSSQFDNS